MKKFTGEIVGIRHYFLKRENDPESYDYEAAKEFLAYLDRQLKEGDEVEVLLQPDGTPGHYDNSVAALIDGRMVGHVGQNFLNTIWRCLEGERTDMLFCNITAVSYSQIKTATITFMGEVEKMSDTTRFDRKSQFDSWHWMGPALPSILEEQELRASGATLEHLLAQNRKWTLPMQSVLNKYKRLTRIGLSYDASQRRLRLADLMLGYKQHDLKAEAAELKSLNAHLGYEESRQHLVNFFFHRLLGSMELEHWMKQNEKADHDQLMASFEAMPFQLAGALRVSPEMFLQQLFYLYPDHEKVKECLSAALFVVKKGWVVLKEDAEEESKEEAVVLPSILSTPEAMRYWEQLQEEGFIDEHYQLADGITRKQAAYIAESFALKLEITHKWKVFETLWNISGLARDKNKMMESGLLPAGYKTINEIFDC